MKVFLAGCTFMWKKLSEEECKNVYRLDSMVYSGKDKYADYTKYKDFILDSGAFTFMKKSGTMDWNRFADQYADFILEKGIKNYIELDLDYIIGVEESLKLRQRIEKRVGIYPSIPCWHLVRGKQSWLDIVKDYRYVSISVSGSDFIPTSKWLKDHKYKQLQWFLDTANEKECKVHGLGFTKTTMLSKYKFYSVDSTAWIKQSAYGTLVRFDGQRIEILKKGDGKTERGKYHKIFKHNFQEWCKYQQYAEKNL